MASIMLSMFDFNWGNSKVPESITIRRPESTDECSATSVGSTSSQAASGDELQALNTALCFLVSINADVEEITSFLLAHPQALLLDGVGPIPEESARCIVQQHLGRCCCFAPTCRQNRLQVIEALERGFEYYETARWEHAAAGSGQIARVYLDELVQLENQIRSWRAEEMTLRHRVMETASEVRQHQGQLDQINTQNRRNLLLSCTARSEVFSRRSMLEYRVGLANLNLSCVGREHQELLRQIRQGRKVQFAVLKQTFSECRRHVCTTANYNAVNKNNSNANTNKPTPTNNKNHHSPTRLSI